MNVVIDANRHLGVLGRLLPASASRPCPPASAAALLGMAELLDAVAFVESTRAELPEVPGVHAVSMHGLAHHSIATVTAAARTAQQHATFARQLFGRLAGECWRSQLRRWSRVAVVALLTGLMLGFLVLGLLVVISIEPGPLLVVPNALVLGFVVVLTDRWRELEHEPPVRGIGAAAADLRAALATHLRARRHATAVARSWAAWAKRNRANVVSWCKRHGVPADAVALRRLATRG